VRDRSHLEQLRALIREQVRIHTAPEVVTVFSWPPKSWPEASDETGFKWFVPGPVDGSVAFGGEESAGASFLWRDGRVWTTGKDGIILSLLAAEITAVTGRSPSECNPTYERIDAPATREQKAALKRLSPDQVSAADLARIQQEARKIVDSAFNASK